MARVERSAASDYDPTVGGTDLDRAGEASLDVSEPSRKPLYGSSGVGPGAVATALALQRSAGNRAVVRALARGAWGSQRAAAQNPFGGVVVAPSTRQLLQRDPAGGASVAANTDQPAAQGLNDPRMSDVVQDLRATALGQAAIGVFNSNSITLTLTSQGRVAAFVPASGSCIINIAATHQEVSAYFVHEMYHASQFYAGKSPGAKGKTHDEWVNMMVAEEIDGTLKGFLHKLALEKASRAKRDDNPPGMQKFRGAYEYALKRAQDAGKNDAEAEQAATSNGRRMVAYLIDPGGNDWPELAPNQFESYRMYYNREWKRDNP